MLQYTQIQKDTYSTLDSIFYKIGDGLLSFFYTLLVVLIGLGIIKLTLIVVEKALLFSNIDKLNQKINDVKLFGKSNWDINLSLFVLSFIKWIMVLVLIIIASDILGWSIISIEITNLLHYLPQLISAFVLFSLGLYFAYLVRKSIFNLFNTFGFKGAGLVSSVLFYVIATLITITALNQAGVDTGIITNNITMLLGAFLITFALSFGLGSKEVLQNLLLTFYARKNYKIGDTLKCKDYTGVVVNIDNISLTLKIANGKVVIPIKEIIDSTIEIEINE